MVHKGAKGAPSCQIQEIVKRLPGIGSIAANAVVLICSGTRTVCARTKRVKVRRRFFWHIARACARVEAFEGSVVEALERMLQMSETQFEILKAMNTKSMAQYISHESEFHLSLKQGGCALLGDWLWYTPGVQNCCLSILDRSEQV